MLQAARTFALRTAKKALLIPGTHHSLSYLLNATPYYLPRFLCAIHCSEAVRFKGLFRRAKKCIDCDEKIKKNQPDASMLGEFRCKHAKLMHYDCARERTVGAEEFNECPICQETFESALPHCQLCTLPITKDTLDAAALLESENVGCLHGKYYHKDCVEKEMKSGMAKDCVLCKKELIKGCRKCAKCVKTIGKYDPAIILKRKYFHEGCVEILKPKKPENPEKYYRSCIKCLEPITSKDPDAKILQVFQCPDAEMFHARCVLHDGDCAYCLTDFKFPNCFRYIPGKFKFFQEPQAFSKFIINGFSYL